MQKRTKIVATLSDLRCTPEFVSDLVTAGVDVFRLNTAHQSVVQCRGVVELIQREFPRVAVLLDTKGPEIRTSAHGEVLEVRTGEPVLVKGDRDGVSGGNRLYVTSEMISRAPLGSSVLIDDGDLELVVTGKQEDGSLECFPQQDGVIKLRKSVNVPNVHIDLPAISDRDHDFLRLGAELGVDFVAHSFVRTAQDVQEVQEAIKGYGGDCKVIAKIENQEGVDNIDSILEYAYGIMVARGDLGIEIPIERVPVVQRKIVQRCIEMRRPVIIATQMLHSMINAPRATRAEISDVANAIYQQSDAVMLSGETAFGKYPVESVRQMVRVSSEVESHQEGNPDQELHRVVTHVTETLCRTAVRACETLPVGAIVIDTLSGRTARYLASFRGRVPIYAMCYREAVQRTLRLSYGIEPIYMEMHESHDKFLHTAITILLDENKIGVEDLILVIGGSFGASNGASFMEISTASNLLRKSHSSLIKEL